MRLIMGRWAGEDARTRVIELKIANALEREREIIVEELDRLLLERWNKGIWPVRRESKTLLYVGIKSDNEFIWRVIEIKSLWEYYTQKTCWQF